MSTNDIVERLRKAQQAVAERDAREAKRDAKLAEHQARWMAPLIRIAKEAADLPLREPSTVHRHEVLGEVLGDVVTVQGNEVLVRSPTEVDYRFWPGKNGTIYRTISDLPRDAEKASAYTVAGAELELLEIIAKIVALPEDI